MRQTAPPEVPLHGRLRRAGLVRGLSILMPVRAFLRGCLSSAVSTSPISCSSSRPRGMPQSSSRVAARSAAVRLVRMSASEGPPF